MVTPTARWRGTSYAGADQTVAVQRWTQWLITPRELCSRGFAPSSRIALKPARSGGFLRKSPTYASRSRSDGRSPLAPCPVYSSEGFSSQAHSRNEQIRLAAARTSKSLCRALSGAQRIKHHEACIKRLLIG